MKKFKGDTSPEIEEKLDEIYRNMPGEKKLMIALGMFDSARNMVLASLPKGLSEKEIRKQLFLRFYGDDFSEDEKKKILEHFDKLEK